MIEIYLFSVGRGIVFSILFRSCNVNSSYRTVVIHFVSRSFTSFRMTAVPNVILSVSEESRCHRLALTVQLARKSP